MLKKEMVMDSDNGPHVVVTVASWKGKYSGDRHIGLSMNGNGTALKGAISRTPCWGTDVLFGIFGRVDEEITISVAPLGASYGNTANISVTRTDNGKQFYRAGYDFFLRDDIGKEIPLRFAPPLQDTCNSVKTVFTRSRKEGVVNAEQRNACYCGWKLNSEGNIFHPRLYAARVLLLPPPRSGQWEGPSGNAGGLWGVYISERDPYRTQDKDNLYAAVRRARYGFFLYVGREGQRGCRDCRARGKPRLRLLQLPSYQSNSGSRTCKVGESLTAVFRTGVAYA